MIEKKQIHVVHIIPKLGFGGAERFVVELCKHVSSETIRQSVITLWDERPLAEELPASVVCHALSFEKISKFKRISVLSRLLVELQADVVHTHLFGGDTWGRLAAYHAGIPVITTEHNINTAESWLWGMIKRAMRHFSDIYTAPSQAVAVYMQNTYKIPLKKIKVIMHGIELKKFIRLKSASFAQPYRLLMIGRVTEQKGHSIALDALQKLADISCVLTIVGDGEKKEELIRYAKKIGVDKRVIWKPGTKNVADEYENCDIVLVPSRWEGLGIVILEALASERLVIATRVGGIPEIIVDQENGILIPPNDSEALAHAIRESIEESGRSHSIAKKARVWAKTHGDVGTMARSYEGLYQKLCNR